jgi:hypothetical protein
MILMVPGHTPPYEQFERNALRLLCSVLIQPVTRVELTALLDAELFLEPLNRVVFEEIAAVGDVPSSKLRELLPARVTNRGFPDFELKEFLAPDLATEGEIEGLFLSVLRMIELRHGEADQGMEN